MKKRWLWAAAAAAAYIGLLALLLAVESAAPEASITTLGRAKRRVEDPGFFAGEATAAQKAEVERRLSYAYPHEASRKMKSKYSVSELNQMAKAADDGAGKYDQC